MFNNCHVYQHLHPTHAQRIFILSRYAWWSPLRDGGNFNYEKPKPLAGEDFCSSYGVYNVHMMGGGITLFSKK